MSFFKRKPTPEKVARKAAEAFQALLSAPDEKGREKAEAEITKRIESMHEIMSAEDVRCPPILELSSHLQANNLVALFIQHLKALNFELRKTVMWIFRFLVHNDPSGFASVYLVAHTEVLASLIRLYPDPELTLFVGSMLRDVIEREALHRTLLFAPDRSFPAVTISLFEFLNADSFEVQADCFKTVRVLLTANKPLVLEFLGESYDTFFPILNSYIAADNFVTRREALKLLGEILLDRANRPVMMRYINDKSNLIRIMSLLRHNNPTIQFEAFNVFKVFVANPSKPPEIIDILANPISKPKLLEFLMDFQSERSEDQFIEEKALLIQTIKPLEPSEAAKRAAAEERRKRSEATAVDSPRRSTPAAASTDAPSPAVH